jgi:formylglycine-generating enzyme required for sulfatase activity
LYVPFKTGDVFRECDKCPEMVVIVPSPSMFPIGTRNNEAQKIKPYAIGRFEITRAQFRASGVQTGKGCYSPTPGLHYDIQRNADGPGFEQGADHPVVCVNWNEIQRYLAWLNEQNGLKLAYRLPTESEWDIGARAGATSRQYWGDDSDQACDYGNVFDLTAAQEFVASAHYQCSDGYAYTAPVGRFKSNALGLYDMIGNVWEWLQDCDRTQDCKLGAAAGGSWYWSNGRHYHYSFSNIRVNHLGFRVARDL